MPTIKLIIRRVLKARLLVLIFAVLSCADYTAEPGFFGLLFLGNNSGSSSASLISFQLLVADNPTLSADITGSIDQNNSTVQVRLPVLVALNSLIPRFIVTDTSSVLVNEQLQISGQSALDFTSGFEIVLKDQAGNTHSYTLTRILDASSGLVHHWSLDGDFIDSVSANNGTNNATVSVANRHTTNNAARLFGAGSNIRMTSEPNLSSTGSWSYSLWVRVDAFGVEASSVGAGNGDFIIDRTPELNPLVNIKISHTNRLVAMYRNTAGGFLTQMPGPLVTLGSWTHLVFVRNYGNQFLFYINATQVAASADGAGALKPPIPILGNHVSGANKFFTGAMDEFRIYNRVLTPTEISNIYNYVE